LLVQEDYEITLEQLFFDDALHIHLARDATDDDPMYLTIDENVDNEAWFCNFF
jgi:hypothetical protein